MNYSAACLLAGRQVCSEIKINIRLYFMTENITPIEFIPKPTLPPSRWQKAMAYFSIFVLFGALAAYFVLDNTYGEKVFVRDDLINRLEETKTKEQKELETKILTAQNKIDDFSNIFDLHVRSSRFFPVFEELCHPKIKFSDFGLNLDQFQASVGGEADTFQSLSQQLLIFREAEQITDVNLTEVSLGEKGKINFKFTLSFKPEIFK